MQSNPEDTDNLSNDGVVRIAAKSMREGLNEVRKALGTDAIILAQEHFPNGVHIWATQDMEVAGRWQLSDTNEPTRDTAREPEAEPQPEPEITLQIEVPPIAEPAAATWADEARSLGFQPHHLETYPSATLVALG